MGHSHGLRSGTRYAFSRDFKQKGRIQTTVYLRQYKVGDIVDIVVNGSVHAGMPYKYYHGKTGVVFNVSKTSVGVIVYRPVGNRYIEKRLNIRIEHVNHSRSREEFLNRVKSNAAARKAAKETGESVFLKRQPVQPREARVVSTVDNTPETISPLAYETTI